MSLDKTHPSLRLLLQPAPFIIVRLPPTHPTPAHLLAPSSAGRFVSVTRTATELSIVAEVGAAGELVEDRGKLKEWLGVSSEAVIDVEIEGPWMTFKEQGPMVLTLTGVMAALTAPLRDAAIPIFAISTFDTDWLLVREHLCQQAVEALRKDGWTVSDD